MQLVSLLNPTQSSCLKVTVYLVNYFIGTIFNVFKSSLHVLLPFPIITAKVRRVLTLIVLISDILSRASRTTLALSCFFINSLLCTSYNINMLAAILVVKYSLCSMG